MLNDTLRYPLARLNDLSTFIRYRCYLNFLAQGFEDLEAISIIDICGWTEYREHIPKVQVFITGFHNKIQGRFGIVVQRHLPLDIVNPLEYDALAIPGGFHSSGFNEAYDKRIHDLANAIYSNGGIGWKGVY